VPLDSALEGGCLMDHIRDKKKLSVSLCRVFRAPLSARSGAVPA
jgi:hypothetical protein